MSVVRLYLPIEAENYHRAYDLIVKECCDFVGGWTEWRASGGWMNDDGERVVEPVMVIETVGDFGMETDLWASALAHTVKEITNEEAVMAVADGEKVLVTD